jgi:hypothetical protein
MTRAEVGQTTFQAAIEHLDAADWAFLKDEKLSAPLWNSGKGFAPPPISETFILQPRRLVPAPETSVKV